MKTLEELSENMQVKNWAQDQASNAFNLLLLLLLSRFSRVQLCATPYMAAHQAPPSLGFSRQEHWSGLPFPSPWSPIKSRLSEWIKIKTQLYVVYKNPL